MSKVDLHLVSWNRPKMTELVIRTILRNTKPGSFRLTVIDNGSDKPTKDMLVDLSDNGVLDELQLFRKNEGLEWARQYALQHCTHGEYFVCIDNDCLPPLIKDGQDWLERMVELMERYEDYAAISMRTQVMIGTGNIFDKADADGDDLVEFPHPGGSFRIMRTQAVQDVGGWDRDAEGRGAEEKYICGKLREVGYRTGFASQIRCLHLFGTRGVGGTDRWGYNVDMKPEESGHSDIAHPALDQGDDREEVLLYVGDKNAIGYYS